MNPDVIVQARHNPPLLEVHDSPRAQAEGIPPLKFTRIWMGIVGPAGREPGYACVVGEVFDGDIRQKARKKILLDEAQALAPGDLSEPDRARYRDLLYARKIEDDGSERDVPKADHPTLDDLRLACAALKDLYWYDFRKSDGGRLLAWTTPGEPQFAQFMRATEGLAAPYPPKQDPEQLRAWHPFFVDGSALTAIADEVPFGEDPDYSRQLVESLLARDDLGVNEHCRLFDDARLEHPVRAVGLVCAAMQAVDWSWVQKAYQESDGYEEMDMTEARRKEMERYCHDYEVRMQMAGVKVRYPITGAEYGAYRRQELRKGSENAH